MAGCIRSEQIPVITTSHRTLDFNQDELSFASWISGNAMYNNFSYMDYYAPALNPRGEKSSFAGWDNQHFGYTGRGCFTSGTLPTAVP